MHGRYFHPPGAMTTLWRPPDSHCKRTLLGLSFTLHNCQLYGGTNQTTVGGRSLRDASSTHDNKYLTMSLQ